MTGILCSVLVPTVPDTRGLTGEGLKEGQEDDKGLQTFQKTQELVTPGRQDVLEGSHHSIQYINGGYKEDAPFFFFPRKRKIPACQKLVSLW